MERGFRGKGLGSLFFDVINDYLLGKLEVKPPLKPQVIFTTWVKNPKAAKKLIDQGHLLVNAPKPSMRTPAFSPIRRGVLEKMFGYDRANQLICERDFLLKRRAYRKRKT